MLIFHTFCLNGLLFKEKNFFNFFSLLFCAGVIKYTCKSVVGIHAKPNKKAHHFPPYHIGNRLEIARFRGGYLFIRSPIKFHRLKIQFLRGIYPFVFSTDFYKRDKRTPKAICPQALPACPKKASPTPRSWQAPCRTRAYRSPQATAL